MTSLVDRHRLIAILKGRGFTEQQAAGVSEAIQEIDLSQLATKEDIHRLELLIRDVELRILKWVVPLLVGQAAVFAAIVKWL